MSKYVNGIILMLTSISAAVTGALVTFNVLNAPEAGALGAIVSALAVGWHSATMRSSATPAPGTVPAQPAQK